MTTTTETNYSSHDYQVSLAFFRDTLAEMELPRVLELLGMTEMSMDEADECIDDKVEEFFEMRWNEMNAEDIELYVEESHYWYDHN